MDDVELVEVLNSSDDLMKELESLRLFYSLVLDDVIEELSSISILHDQVKLLWRLNDLIQLDNIWVADHLKNVDFTSDSLDIVHVLYLIFLQNFDSDSFIGQLVNAQLHFSERALSNRLVYKNIRAQVSDK